MPLKYFKFIVTLVGIFVLSTKAYAQFDYLPREAISNQTVQHSAISLGYAEQFEQAAWVAYKLKESAILGRASRKNYFREDPFIITGSASLKDYKYSGYSTTRFAGNLYRS